MNGSAQAQVKATNLRSHPLAHPPNELTLWHLWIVPGSLSTDYICDLQTLIGCSVVVP